MEFQDLTERTNEYNAKGAILSQVFKDAKNADGKLDLALVKKWGDEDVSTLTTTAKADRIAKANQELADLKIEMEPLEAVKRAYEAAEEIEKRKLAGTPIVHPGQSKKAGDYPEVKSIGEQFVESEPFKGRGDSKTFGIQLAGYPSDLMGDSMSGVKTLMSTSAGWAPENIRIPRVIDAVTRPIKVIDIMPFGPTSQAAIVYMLESTRTHSAAEATEGAAFGEDAFALTATTSTVRKIASNIPVTDEQLDDVAQVRAYLNQRLSFGLRQRLDGQILTGDGSAPNLEGVLNVTGIQTQALGGDSVPDAVYKAMDLIRVTGRATPSHAVFHPNDWQPVRLLTTADGVYIWGHPSDAGIERIWGIPVIQTDAETENTAVVGDFTTYSGLWEKQGVDLQVGYVGDQFKEGEQTIRATLRVALCFYRPAAFATVTGI